MGSKSKGKKRRDVDFSSGIRILSDMMDQKQLEYTKNFTSTLGSMKLRVQVLEELLKEKFGETEESLQERTFLKIESEQGFQQVDTEVVKGSVLRVKVKEEEVGKESPTNPMQDAYMCVGHNQINAAVDTLVIGAKPGETRDVTLPDPKNVEVQRKITITVLKIFKGEESVNETQENQAEEAVSNSEQAVS